MCQSRTARRRRRCNQTTQPTAAVVDTSQAGALKVYLDCNRCDFDFMRDQMRWVNWVRDRLFADVLVLVTSLGTGAGGTEYTVAAIGGERYRGRGDTAVVVAALNDADDAVRRSLARTFASMLAPYAAKTPLAPRLTLTCNAPTWVTTRAGALWGSRGGGETFF